MYIYIYIYIYIIDKHMAVMYFLPIALVLLSAVIYLPVLS